VEALHDWHEFYLMLGSAAGALVALLFVAISIGVGFFTHRRQAGTRTFTSPVIVHFSALLFISAIALAPVHGMLTLVALVAAGIVGAIIAAVRGAPLRPWLAGSIVGDLSDLVATLGGRDELPKGSATATLVVGGSSALISAAVAVAVES